jgi:hypothetical protein
MEPPMAIICMCLPFRLLFSPPSPSSTSSPGDTTPAEEESKSETDFSWWWKPILMTFLQAELKDNKKGAGLYTQMVRWIVLEGWR